MILLKLIYNNRKSEINNNKYNLIDLKLKFALNFLFIVQRK